MQSLSDEIESILFIGKRALVYRVPPRTSNEGYKAANWNSDQGLLWQGRIRVIEKGKACEIRLEDPNSGELFALAKYSSSNNSVEPVLDSSRYFVLRVEGDQGQKAYIGLGFEERTDAFDFNVALQDYTKHLSDPNPQGPSEPPPPAKDFSLKEGQTFSIKIPGRELKTRPERVESDSRLATSGGMPFLPPPPSRNR